MPSARKAISIRFKFEPIEHLQNLRPLFKVEGMT